MQQTEIDQSPSAGTSAYRPGMMKIEESMGDMPPNWGVYFLVEDVEALVAKAQELGGNSTRCQLLTVCATTSCYAPFCRRRDFSSRLILTPLNEPGPITPQFSDYFL